MKYFISSNLNYFRKTYPFIIKSLTDAGIEEKDIYMIVGACKEKIEFNNFLKINLFYVDYNSFDFTALIYAAENFNKINDEHLFLLHDTCLVGKNFKKLSENYKKESLIKKLHKSISMNIGLYSLKFIENSQALKNFKTYPCNENELQKCKEFFVLNEDYIFKQSKNDYNNNYYSIYEDSEFPSKEKLTLTFPEYYHNYLKEIKRRTQYIPDLDLYKFQANIGWRNFWTIGI